MITDIALTRTIGCRPPGRFPPGLRRPIESAPEDLGSDIESRRSAVTGYLFEQSIRTTQVGQALDRLADIGRREHWLLDPSEIQIAPQHILGRGCFGVVVAGAYSGLNVAVKMSLRSFDAGRAGRSGRGGSVRDGVSAGASARVSLAGRRYRIASEVSRTEECGGVASVLSL